jgi:hypothetical protein
MEKDGKIGAVGEYSVKLEGGKAILTIAFDEKVVIDSLIAKLPDGFVKDAAKAAEGAVLSI